jgi:hypothetical protein
MIHGWCGSDFFRAGRSDFLQTAEVLQQGVATRFTNAWNIVEQRMNLRFAPALTVMRNRETVRFVANALH